MINRSKICCCKQRSRRINKRQLTPTNFFWAWCREITLRTIPQQVFTKSFPNSRPTNLLNSTAKLSWTRCLKVIKWQIQRQRTLESTTSPSTPRTRAEVQSATPFKVQSTLTSTAWGTFTQVKGRRGVTIFFTKPKVPTVKLTSNKCLWDGFLRVFPRIFNRPHAYRRSLSWEDWSRDAFLETGLLRG